MEMLHSAIHLMIASLYLCHFLALYPISTHRICVYTSLWLSSILLSAHSSLVFYQTTYSGNLLVTKDCRLRIADFGLARERPTGRGIDPDEEIDGTYAHEVDPF